MLGTGRVIQGLLAEREDHRLQVFLTLNLNQSAPGSRYVEPEVDISGGCR
jgi:hypothetical protein